MTKAFKLNDGFQLPMLAAVLSNQYDVISAVGGWGSGKSYFDVFALMTLGELYPGIPMAIVTDTFSRAEKIIDPICQDLLPEEGWRSRGAGGGAIWTAPNGSKIYVIGYNREATKAATANRLEGMDLCVAAVDECQTWSTNEVMQKLVGRTRRRYPGLRNLLIMTGLPVASPWWIKSVENSPRSFTMRVTSMVNRENQSEDWLEKAKDLLDPDEYEAMVLGRPRPPKGQIYSMWSDALWPDGNIVDWTPPPGSEVTIGIDFGLHVAVLFIAHDPVRNIDVVFEEIALDECVISDWAQRILRVAWPATPALRRHKPIDVPYWLVGGAGDKAGRARDSHGTDDISWLRRPPPEGIGLHIGVATDPVKVDVANGIKRVQRLIHNQITGHRQLVCTRELWERQNKLGEKRRTFSRSLQRYHWMEDGSGRAKKDGYSDHQNDSLRYWCINYRWYDSPLDEYVIKNSVHTTTIPKPTRPALISSGRPRGN